MRIPRSFRTESSEYLTIPILKSFCNSVNLRTTYDRAQLIESIETFSEQNQENEKIVSKWLDGVLKEGIKHIYARKVFAQDNRMELLKYETTALSILREVFPTCPMTPVIQGNHNKDITVQNYGYIITNGVIDSIWFTLTQLLLEANGVSEPGDKIIYPIFIDIDLKNGYIIGRAKSKANIFNDDGSGISSEKTRTTVDKQIKLGIDKIIKQLNLTIESVESANAGFKHALYKTLCDFTFTPDEIKEQIDDYELVIDQFIIQTFKDLDIDPLKDRNYEKAQSDIRIFIEKYISINYPDRSIFTKDREAYPIRLASTDSEQTRVDEASGNSEPLQCKEKFFDNKKSTVLEMTCDRLTLCYNRKERYFGNTPFIVKILTKTGYCILRFESYVEEDDIQNVLSRIIRNRE